MKVLKKNGGWFVSCVVGATFLGAALAPEAFALTPGRPITLVIPFALGGPGEFVGRLMIPAVQEKLKSPVLLESRQGAGGAIGITSVIRADPDGHTLLWTSNSITIDPAIKLKPAYDPIRDLRPITMGVAGAQAFNMNPQVPAANLRELIAYAKANPGKLNYAHAGYGTHTNMVMELFKVRTGTDIVSIPFRGGGQQALLSTIANDTQLTLLPPDLTREHVLAGKLKMIAIASEKRVPFVPDVPTVIESGLPGFVATFWYGLFAPLGTSSDDLKRIEAAVTEALAAPDLRAKVEGRGYIPGGTSSADFRRQIEAELEQWRDVVTKAKIPRE